jgi:phenylalanyl-tRNA synthetase beta chain
MVISDDAGPESIAGIMGGLATGCTEATTEVFLESAYWDHVQIAHTGRALKINSDARYRNERGVDPAFTLPGLELATQMILDLCGGEASEVVIAGAGARSRPRLPLDTGTCKALVGMDIPESETAPDADGAGLRLDGDMAHPADLAARRAGRGRSGRGGRAHRLAHQARRASRCRAHPVCRAGDDADAAARTGARRTCAALGYNECVTYSFIDAASAALFGGGERCHHAGKPDLAPK